MNSKHESQKRRSYQSALRDQQAADTRALILKAVGEQLAATGPSELSVPDVARRAGVTCRTIYRHFGSRKQLVEALEAWVSQRAIPPLPTRLEDLWAYPVALFTAFDQHATWIEAMLQAGPGAELRAAGKANRVAAVRRLLSGLTEGLGEDLGVQAAGVVKHLLSAEAWRSLRADFGLDGPSAGRAVRWALEALGKDLFRRRRAGRGEAMPVECALGDLPGVSFAMAAAIESGLLLELIDGSGRTAAGYAEALEIDARAAARVLDVLVAAGLARRSGDSYSASAQLSAMAGVMAGGLAFNLALFQHTREYLRTGEPLTAMDGDTAGRAAQYRNAVGGLAQLFAAPARVFAAGLPEGPHRVLDVGCGSGVWSLAVAERFPQARVTGQDLPGVLEAFEARATELGLRDRCERLEGDMHEVQLPEAGFDLAIVANVLRLEPPDRARALLQRMARAVRPGGAVAVIDALAAGTQERELARAVYALHLALRTRNGRVHSPEELRTWLEEAGVSEVRPLDLGVHPGAVGALVGIRR